MKKMWIRHSLCAASLGLLAMPAGAIRADEESARDQEEQRKSNIVVVKAQDGDADEASEANEAHATFVWNSDDGTSSEPGQDGQSVVLSRDGQVIVLKKVSEEAQDESAEQNKKVDGEFRFEFKLDNDGTVHGVQSAKEGANHQGVFQFLNKSGASADNAVFQIQDGRPHLILKAEESADDEESSNSRRRFRFQVQNQSDEDSAADAAQDDQDHAKQQYRVEIVPDGNHRARVFRWQADDTDVSDADASPSDGQKRQDSDAADEEHSPRVMIWKSKSGENQKQDQRIEVHIERAGNEKEGSQEKVAVVTLDDITGDIQAHGDVHIVVVKPDGERVERIHEMLLNQMKNGDEGDHVKKVIITRGDGSHTMQAEVMEMRDIELDFNHDHEIHFMKRDEPKMEKRRVRVFTHRQEDEEADDENETEVEEIELKGVGGVFQLRRQGDSTGDKEASPMIVELNEKVLNQDGKKALAKLLENEDLPKEVRDMIKKHIGESVQLRKLNSDQPASIIVQPREGQSEKRRIHIERADNPGEALIVGRVLGTDLEHKIVENVLQWHSKENDQRSNNEDEVTERMEEIEAKLLRLEAKIDRLLKDRHN